MNIGYSVYIDYYSGRYWADWQNSDGDKLVYSSEHLADVEAWAKGIGVKKIVRVYNS
jgi:hypothetical protein